MRLFAAILRCCYGNVSAVAMAIATEETATEANKRKTFPHLSQKWSLKETSQIRGIPGFGYFQRSHGSPWISMVPWFPMEPHGSPWVPMRSHGIPWASMDPHGSRTPMVLHRLPWGPAGSLCFPTGSQRDRMVPMGSHGSS